MSSESAPSQSTQTVPWVVAQPEATTRPLRVPRGRGAPPPWRAWVIALLLIALGLGAAGTAIGAGLTVRDLEVSIAAAQAHLARAETSGAQLSANPFDNALLMQTRDELAAATQDFVRAQGDANRLAPAQIVPKVGLKVQDGRALLEMAVTLCEGGGKALDAAEPVIQGLKASLATQSGAAGSTNGQPGASAQPSLTTAQLLALQQAVAAFAGDLDQARAARQQIPDGAVTLGASATHLLARYDQLAPTLSAAVTSLRVLLAAAPILLGTDHPASYLIEMLDETELRGGGGFIGNYGLLTVTDARLSKAVVQDTYLLDDPYQATHSRAVPAQYSWFPLTTNLGLRDSDLSPDFPQNAQLAAQIYQQESGQSVTGVAAITPAFIANLLNLTGPVAVPGYPVTVTSQNLVQTIHDYQFQTNAQGVPSSDGVSSTRKHFTAVLGETVFARLRSLPASDYATLLKLAQAGLKSKDLQLYLVDPTAQALMVQRGLANALPSDAPAAAPSDMLALVDDNVGGNKADLYVTQTATDDVTIQPNGSAQHTLTLVYSYRPGGSVYGVSTTFADEAQVYVPHGSVLNAASGLDTVDQPYNSTSYTVFGGALRLTPYTTRTVTLRWTTPSYPARAYQLVVDRQAGSLYTYAVAIHPPTSAAAVKASAPLTLSAGRASYASPGPLAEDLHFAISWR